MIWSCWSRGSTRYALRLSWRDWRTPWVLIRSVRPKRLIFRSLSAILSGSMKMAQNDRGSIWDALSAPHRTDRFLRGDEASADLAEVVRSSSLGGRRDEL